MNLAPTITADRLNEHIAKGGRVQLTNHYKSWIYRTSGETWFRDGASGCVYVRRGKKSWDCITMSNGTPLLSIRLI